VDEAWHLSHYAWRDETTLLLYGGSESLIERIKGNRILGQLVIRPLRPLARRLFRPDGFVEKLVGPYSFFLLDTATRQRSPLAGAGVRSDGHPSFNPLRPDIAVFDTYEDAADSRHLFLFHMGSGRRAEIGRFHSPRWSNEQAFRCDLHPRWDRQGSRVIIDSLHGGVRRSFVYDVSAVVRNLEDWVS
jgi:hypothetical protein